MRIGAGVFLGIDAGAALDPRGRIDNDRPRAARRDAFRKAVLERHPDLEEQLCPTKPDNLPRRQFEDVRVLARLH